MVADTCAVKYSGLGADPAVLPDAYALLGNALQADRDIKAFEIMVFGMYADKISQYRVIAYADATCTTQETEGTNADVIARRKTYA